MAPLFNWGVKDSHRGTPVVVKMENPNWSMVELEGPSEEDLLITNPSSRDKGRGKNAKQLTWVLLLKAHRAAGCLTSIAPALFGFVSAVKRRVASGRTDADIDGVGVGGGRENENPTVKSWHFSAPHLELWAPAFGVKDVFDWFYARWVLIRVEYLAPPLQFLTNACIVLFLIQSVDRLVLCLGCFWIKFKKIKPIPKGGHGLDLESGDKGFFPMVLVQIPMCNEKEVYQQSIAAVCNLDWPKSNFLIQVLDDSDDPVTSSLIQEEVQKWQQEGANILYRHRVIRDGYKAGNLKSAMNCSYVKDY
ncbi:putative xyloglucan glycosyltransferase 12-like, partial [Trifolium medium]|nr:putative xyloglucan glycosyltransferase 12-like [Trifolium medium]